MSPQLSDTVVAKYVRAESQLYYVGVAQAHGTSLQDHTPETDSGGQKPFVISVKIDDLLISVDPTQTETLSDIQFSRSKYLGTESRPEVCYQCESTVDSTNEVTVFEPETVSEDILQLESTDRYIRICDSCSETLIQAVCSSVENDPSFSSFFVAQSI